MSNNNNRHNNNNNNHHHQHSILHSNEDLSKLDESLYEKSPTGHIFVRSTTKKGILPLILDELLAARKRAKKDMALATDPMEKAG